MKNMKRFCASLFLGAIFCLAAHASSPWIDPAEPVPVAAPAAKSPAPMKFLLDHYKVYAIAPADVSFQVYLRGQFDGDLFQDTKVYRYERFLNPADKNGEGIIDKYAHLNWYAIFQEQLEPVRKVTIDNQFGVQTFKIDQPVALLVPAEKVEPGSQFPAKLDHYKVYRIIVTNEFITAPVNIQDQFGSEDNLALQPTYFAVPVEKKHADAYYPINNPQDHLVFYQLEPKDWQVRRRTKDQFGNLVMTTRYSDLLGVPSLKLGWE